MQKKTFTAIASKVLAVAVLNINEETGELFDWACYVDSVRGHNHSQEFEAVASVGDKQPKRFAEVFFPQFDISKYRY